MAKSRRLVVGAVMSVFLAGAGMVAAQQEKVPSEQLIVRLLTLESEWLPADYRVAIVLPGEMRGRTGFVVERAARVTFIGPVFEGGSKRRGVCEEIFLWNVEYGWFRFEIDDDRRGAVVRVWSELKGEVEVR